MADGRFSRQKIMRVLVLIAGIAAGFLIAEAIFGIWSPVERNGRLFGKNMKELSVMASGDEVNLTDITPFAWDTVYSFDPYVTKDEMETVLGFESRHLKETVSEGMVQLVFVKANEVVCSICGYRDNLGYSVNLGSWGQERPYRRVYAGSDHFTLEKDQDTPVLQFQGDEFEGIIEKRYDSGSILVKIDDSWDICSSGDRVTIQLPEELHASAAVGDRIRVSYDGMVMETYPLQLGDYTACLIKPGTGEEDKIDFSDVPFGDIACVEITSGHTGNSVFIREEKDIKGILDFLAEVKGVGRMSGKGYYEGSFSVTLYESDTRQPVFRIGFGDESTFYYGVNDIDKGYPNRYELEGMTVDEVVGFFERYLPLS